MISHIRWNQTLKNDRNIAGLLIIEVRNATHADIRINTPVLLAGFPHCLNTPSKTPNTQYHDNCASTPIPLSPHLVMNNSGYFTSFIQNHMCRLRFQRRLWCFRILIAIHTTSPFRPVFVDTLTNATAGQDCSPQAFTS